MSEAPIEIPNVLVRTAAQAIAETFNEGAGPLATGEVAGSVADDWLSEARAALEAALPALMAARTPETDDEAAAPDDGAVSPPASEAIWPAASSSLPGYYDDDRTLTITGGINHEAQVELGDQEVFYTSAEDLVKASVRAAVEANVGVTRADLALVMDVSDATDLRTEIAAWMARCSCDAGLPSSCICSGGDMRALLGRIYTALGGES